MILLVGATGRLGTAVVERLLLEGTVFRAACRNPSKCQWLLERGVDVVRLDLESGAGLHESVAGATHVISCTHGLLGKSRRAIEQVDVLGNAALIDASAAAGIQRFVYMSALGASPLHPSEFWRAKARTEQHLRASELEHVILRPSAFMDLYAHDLIGAAVVRGKTVFLLGSGRTRRNMIAVSDVADAAIRALFSDDLANETIEIGSPDNPTEREIAALYAGLSGKKGKVRSLPDMALRALGAAIAPFHAGIGRVLRLPLQLAGREELCVDTTSSMKRLGITPISLRQFAEERVRAGEAAAR